jgi:hypothetical protein
MHHHGHTCCSAHYRGTSALSVDPRFADDEFTQAAALERRARAAHAHGMSLLVLVLGGFLFLGIAKKLFGNDR